MPVATVSLGSAYARDMYYQLLERAGKDRQVALAAQIVWLCVYDSLAGGHDMFVTHLPAMVKVAPCTSTEHSNIHVYFITTSAARPHFAICPCDAGSIVGQCLQNTKKWVATS